MRLVVTGAAGFLGSVLTQRAVERGHLVLALDDLSRGLNSVGAVAGAVFTQHDCQGGIAETLASTLWSARELDAVVHFAAGTGSLDRPYEELVALNVDMTKRVYDDALRLGAKAFVYPTTSLATAVPDSPYVRSKEEALTWLLGVHAAPDESPPVLLPLRLFNVVGAYRGFTELRQREVHLVPELCRCRQTGKTFVINGADYDTVDGTPSRDFVHVLDVVDFILVNLEMIVLSGALHPGALRQDDGAVWVGTGWATTVTDVMTIFEQWTGARIKVERGPRRAYDCGALWCRLTAPGAVREVLGRPMAPAWVGIRDEALALLGGPHDLAARRG
jgi:UDP-glucose 4-epimerase